MDSFGTAGGGLSLGVALRLANEESPGAVIGVSTRTASIGRSVIALKTVAMVLRAAC